ncbi:unnamed protein product [Mytilus edulis]|uniref:Uncharacterized protein n=1 Tax=Mytilus edulis TaxID=6550 RepID=A0A8S3R4Y6_MYTED|nr:unnamed protein product [Mytilus edulis]
MASPLNLSDKTKVDKQSLHNETTESENAMSEEGDNVSFSDMTEEDKLLPHTELEDGKQSSNSLNSNNKHTLHNETSESESEYSQSRSRSDISNKSFRNDNLIDDSPVTVQNRTESDIDNKSLRNDNGIEDSSATVQNSSPPDNFNTLFRNDNRSDQKSSGLNISNNYVRNESSPFTVLENALANCGPAAVPPYIKCLFIVFCVFVVLMIATVLITISIVKKPCQERPLAEANRGGPVVEDIYIVFSIWDDNMDKLNVSVFGKKDVLLYQIDYQGNGARNQIVVCQHGESAFSISCGEEKTNSCVHIPEYPNKNPETFPKHFNYVIDRQCIGKKADLRWKT